MTVWAISDLHLSFARPERRERYAARWQDHAAKLQANWIEAVRPEDVVLLPGDISMARNHRELQADFAWLDRLPGKKVLSAGNHDGWWNGVEKLRPQLRRSLHVVGGDAQEIQGVIVCGTRGVAPLTEDLSPDQNALVGHELGELDRAINQARDLRTHADQPIHVLWHFPPFDSFGRPGPAVPRLEAERSLVCLYGHLHIENQWSRAVQGERNGVRYHCVAADAVGFRPLRIGSRDRAPTKASTATSPHA
jgi:predicted phosphohydrolase